MKSCEKTIDINRTISQAKLNLYLQPFSHLIIIYILVCLGSENSLLNMTDEDLWLRKGMDEDGSFRQVYMD